MELLDFDVGGDYPNPSGMEGFLYGERDIYRPGENIRLAGIVRNHDLSTPKNVPVLVKVMMPNGNELQTFRKNLNDQGGFETKVMLSQSVPTGTYTANLYTADEQLLNTQYLSVEEFVPDRIKVNLSTNKDEFEINDSIQVNIEAVNLFGPPAANRNYEVQVNLNRKYFSPEENGDYIYNIKRDIEFPSILREGKTNANGKAGETFSFGKRIP